MNGGLAAYWRSVASGARGGILSLGLRCALLPASFLYGVVQRVRIVLYRTGVLQVKRLPRPVISVGNITVGGTGKTPFTAFLAGLLMARGLKVAVLTRGYGGTLEGQTAVVSDGRELFLRAGQCGDEPFLLASRVPGLVVVIGSDRHAAGLLAIETCAPDVFVLDDGFQHLRLHRDLDILLMDGRRPFGNGLTLPAGLLREPRGGSVRADLLVMTRCPAGEQPKPAVPDKPCCHARHSLVDLQPLTGQGAIEFSALAGNVVAACAGIAEPQAFFDGLQDLGLRLAATLPLPDHVEYDAVRIAELEELLRVSGAEFIVTTEKDGVKLDGLPPALARKVLLARLRLTLDEPAPLEGLLLNLLQI